jgi:hypothetical protein
LESLGIGSFYKTTPIEKEDWDLFPRLATSKLPKNGYPLGRWDLNGIYGPKAVPVSPNGSGYEDHSNYSPKLQQYHLSHQVAGAA